MAPTENDATQSAKKTNSDPPIQIPGGTPIGGPVKVASQRLLIQSATPFLSDSTYLDLHLQPESAIKTIQFGRNKVSVVGVSWCLYIGSHSAAICSENNGVDVKAYSVQPFSDCASSCREHTRDVNVDGLVLLIAGKKVDPGWNPYDQIAFYSV